MASVRIYFAHNFRVQPFHSAIFRRVSFFLSHPVYQRCKMLTDYKYRHAHVLNSVVGTQYHSAHSKRVVCTCVAFVSSGSVRMHSAKLSSSPLYLSRNILLARLHTIPIRNFIRFLFIFNFKSNWLVRQRAVLRAQIKLWKSKMKQLENAIRKEVSVGTWMHSLNLCVPSAKSIASCITHSMNASYSIAYAIIPTYPQITTTRDCRRVDCRPTNKICFISFFSFWINRSGTAKKYINK